MYLPLNLGMVEPTVHTLSASCSKENFLSLYTQHCICVCNISARLSLLPSHPPSTSHPVLVSRKTRRLYSNHLCTHLASTHTYPLSMPTYLLTLHAKNTRSLKHWKANSQVLPITPSPSPSPQTTHTHHSSFILLPCHHERGPFLEHAKQCQHSHQYKVGAGMSRNIGRIQLHPGLIPRPHHSTHDGMGMRSHIDYG